MTIDENIVRRNAWTIWSASPQISESKPLPPASNTPTMVHSRNPKRRRSPMATPSKRSAMLLPTTISELPGRQVRPATMCTWGRRTRPRSPAPRITTFEGLPLPRLGSEISTSTSFETSGRPSRSSATSGCDSTTPACARSTALCTSVPDERRMISTLS